MPYNESFARIQIATFAWFELRKKPVIELHELEEQFNRYCEGVMHELVVRGIFHATNTKNDIAWYLHENVKHLTVDEFREKLKEIYKYSL